MRNHRKPFQEVDFISVYENYFFKLRISVDKRRIKATLLHKIHFLHVFVFPFESLQHLKKDQIA